MEEEMAIKRGTKLGAAALGMLLGIAAAVSLDGQQPGEPYGQALGGAEAPAYADAIRQARTLVQDYMAEKGIPGASIAVGLHGRIIWSEGFGYANVEYRIPVTPQTKFRGGSTSKPMTQALASLLKEAGRFDFDSPVQTYVPSFPDKGVTITARHLMGHNSGIRHYPPDGDEFHSTVAYANITDALVIFRDDPLLFDPGTDVSYTTYGANLLGAAAQTAAGVDFLTAITRYVTEPLEMRETVGDHNDSIIVNRTGYYERTNQPPHYHLRQSSWGDGSTLGVLLNAPYVDNSNKWAGGGFLTTPEDLVRFGSAHLEPGFLSAESLEEIFTPVTLTSGQEINRGLNWVLGTDPYGGRTASHGGGGVGSNTAMTVFLDEGFVIAIQANLSQSSPGVLTGPVSQLFLEAGRESGSRR